jgi:hypothetical protein
VSLVRIIQRRYERAKPQKTRQVTPREMLAARISARNRSGH